MVFACDPSLSCTVWEKTDSKKMAVQARPIIRQTPLPIAADGWPGNLLEALNRQTRPNFCGQPAQQPRFENSTDRLLCCALENAVVALLELQLGPRFELQASASRGGPAGG
jgi:hypothetical protein